jgi:hypothetical protein
MTEIIPPKKAHDRHTEALLMGNNRVPQGPIGIVSELGLSLLRDPHFEVKTFIESPMRQSDLELVTREMHARHGAHHIPVATAEGAAELVEKIQAAHGEQSITKDDVSIVDARRFGEYWVGLKYTTLGTIAASVGLLPLTFDPVRIDEEHIARIQARLDDPRSRARSIRIFALMTETLRTPKGNELVGGMHRVSSNRGSGPKLTPDQRNEKQAAIDAQLNALNEYVLGYVRDHEENLLDQATYSLLNRSL